MFCLKFFSLPATLHPLPSPLPCVPEGASLCVTSPNSERLCAVTWVAPKDIQMAKFQMFSQDEEDEDEVRGRSHLMEEGNIFSR